MHLIDTYFPLVRLDRTSSPFGPCPSALEALEARVEASAEFSAGQLKRRIADSYRIPIESLLIRDGIDRCLLQIVASQSGSFVGFPPSATAALLADACSPLGAIWIARERGQRSAIDADAACDVPTSAVAIVQSPCDPLGALLTTAEAVRLARACRFLVIDERFVEFSGMSLLPLAAEFDNIAVLRSFETWAGIDHPPCAWVATSPRTAAALGVDECAIEVKAMAAAMATLNDLDAVCMTLKLVREERSRLYRLLRKFSFLEPLPSWGPFVSARVQVGSRDALVIALQARGVLIHAPRIAGLERFVRIGIGSRRAMERLRSALLDVAPEMVR